MKVAEIVFWVSALLIAHTLFLYPIVLFLAYSVSQVRRDWKYLTGRRNRRASALREERLPCVTLIVPAYNEQDCLEKKILNVNELDYPADKLEVIVVSDGSTDGTNEILLSLNQTNLMPILLPKRMGKANALNVAIARAQHDTLVFSDASTLFAPDAIKRLVRHFADPKIGVVCGALEFERTEESRQTEGVYWKYESMMRLMEARLGATLTASGAMFAMRREAFQPMVPGTVIEDFVIPMNARNLGYRVCYDPEAWATEVAASSVVGEFKRRVRLAVGSFRALRGFFKPGLHGFAWIAFVSHKLLRWILPFLLLAVLLSSAFLLDRPLYRAVFLGQMLFLVWASAGFIFRKQMRGTRFAMAGYFLLAMNLAFFIGFIRFLIGREEGLWQRVN